MDAFDQDQDQDPEGRSCFFKDPSLKGAPACESVHPSPLDLQKAHLEKYAEPLHLEIFDGPPNAPYGDCYATGRAELAPVEPGPLVTKPVSIVITAEALAMATNSDPRLDLLAMLKFSHVEVRAIVIKSNTASMHRTEQCPGDPDLLQEALYTIPESTTCLKAWVDAIRHRPVDEQPLLPDGHTLAPVEDRYLVLVFSIDWDTLEPFSDRYIGQWPDPTCRISYIEGPMEYRGQIYRSETWLLPNAPGRRSVSTMRFFPVPTEDPVPSHIHPSMIGPLRAHLFAKAAELDTPPQQYHALIRMDLVFVEYSLLPAIRRLMTRSILQTPFDTDHTMSQQAKRHCP